MTLAFSSRLFGAALGMTGIAAVALSFAAPASAGPIPAPTAWNQELYSACVNHYGSSAAQQCCVGTGGRWVVKPGAGGSCKEIGGPVSATIDEIEKPVTVGASTP
jgi:hypothetical protein